MSAPGELTGFGPIVEYLPIEDRREFADLTAGERVAVAQAWYERYWAHVRAERARLAPEVEAVLKLPDKAARSFHMEQFRATRPNDYARLAALVRFEYLRRMVAA
jgi:hypothetical protein